ncbi:MAG: GTP-binding protein [Desulfobacteraceae bacterium]|nr:GTP-binding protein [Desulfobacteraceae bacterium]
MGAHTQVILVGGFLGSGKTTFLNRLIAAVPKGYKVVVLMNEFGEIGIDGQILQAEDLDLVEINRGSIFCICVKTDFIKALHRIGNDIRPDLLIIEPTGVANPLDLKTDFKLPLYKDRFRFLDQVCILDAVYFEDAYEAFASVEKQVASSTLFVINKVDLAPREKIERIKEIVRAHHSAPVFAEAVFCDFPFERILGKLAPAANAGDCPDPGSFQPLSASEVDEVASMILADPFREVRPPDNLVSAVFSWPGKTLRDFRDLVGVLPRGVVRGKGFLRGDGKTYLLSVIMGNVSFEQFSAPVRPDLVGNVVLIFPPDLEAAVDRVLSEKGARLRVLSPDMRAECGPAAFEKPV